MAKGKKIKILSLAKFQAFLMLLFGFISGFIEALLYNLFAKWFGGIEIDI